MQVEKSQPKPGDIYLLFHDLAYDFTYDLSVELPLPVGPGVYLDNTPQRLLSLAEKGLADFVLPGYSLPGRGINNCCLRCYSTLKSSKDLVAKNLLFLALLSMRLHYPINIDIAGQFSFENETEPISHPELYELRSPWSISGSYVPSDIVAIEKVANRVIEVENLGFNRLVTGLIFFSHVTLGQITSYQLATMGLFASLEALFVPNKTKANTLSERIARFLSKPIFPSGNIDEWIRSEYLNTRHKIAHGVHDATFGMELRSDRHHNLGLLHEICRLSLLGFLSLDDSKLKELSTNKGKGLHRILDTLMPATVTISNNYKYLLR